jgi:hypothetical protein
MNATARTSILALLTALLLVSVAHAQELTLTPHEIPEGAKNIRLRVQRTDGRSFTSQPSTTLSVGIAFGTTLVMFAAKPDRPRGAQSLTVFVKDPGLTWQEVPRAGDKFLVAVYLNKSPITAATTLHVIGNGPQSTTTHLKE